MRFLIDNSLSPKFAAGMRRAGHVRDYGLQDSPDGPIFERAAAEERVLVTADTDFGTLLAQRSATKPSVILFRIVTQRRADRRLAILFTNLDGVRDALDVGAIVTVELERVRVRMLPIRGRDDG